jgi:hypothetical protein
VTFLNGRNGDISIWWTQYAWGQIMTGTLLGAAPPLII